MIGHQQFRKQSFQRYLPDLRRYKELLQRSLLQFGMTWHALAVNLKTRFPGTHHQNKFALHILQEQLLQSKLVLLKQLGNCIWLHRLRLFIHRWSFSFMQPN